MGSEGNQTGARGHNVSQQYDSWKRLVPYLYDCFMNHHLTWPSLSCRWGPKVIDSGRLLKQKLYLSEQTDGSEPNKLVLVTAEISKSRKSLETLSNWSEQVQNKSISKPMKTLYHPGEVNKLLELPQHQNIVITHSDTPEIFVWNFDTQKDKRDTYSSQGMSTPDVTLIGHTENAEFALGTCNIASKVASGGKDKAVLVWDIGDHVTGASKKRGNLRPQTQLYGHTNTVEDVTFKPRSMFELASVADDYSLMLWDTRFSSDPAANVTNAHGSLDVHCCDWSELMPHLILTGAQDGGVMVWDTRKLAEPLKALHHHTKAVMNVEWSHHSPGVFASGADDGFVCIWDLNISSSKRENESINKRLQVPAQEELIFQHAGHKSPVVDFCWNPDDPWMLMSASVDASSGGGGTLQLWRVSDLIYRKEEEVLAELEPYKEYIATGSEKILSKKRKEMEEAQHAAQEKASSQ
eukprot:jgi/Picsp_1/26/NSC_00026-R1_wd repeat protein